MVFVNLIDVSPIFTPTPHTHNQIPHTTIKHMIWALPQNDGVARNLPSSLELYPLSVIRITMLIGNQAEKLHGTKCEHEM